MILKAADIRTSRAGKVRGHYCSPEVRLSQFIRLVENPHPSWKAENPISEWVEVKSTDSGLVIYWGGFGLKGQVEWKHLPESVNSLYIGKGIRKGKLRPNLLNGSIEFSTLPRGVEEFSVEGHIRGEFSGTLDFTQLPIALRGLNIEKNRFCGNVDFTMLPVNLEYAWLANNFFSGRVDFSKLPPKLLLLTMNSGIVYHGQLPKFVEIY